MKLYPALLTLFLVFGLGGCANDPVPWPPPFMGIASVRKLGDGPREQSQFVVKIHYENLLPEHHEIKVGFGYVPPPNSPPEMKGGSEGLYSVAVSEVVHKASGDLEITIEPSGVRKLGASLDGKIYAVLSNYPHGAEWKVVRRDVYPLDP